MDALNGEEGNVSAVPWCHHIISSKSHSSREKEYLGKWLVVMSSPSPDRIFYLEGYRKMDPFRSRDKEIIIENVPYKEIIAAT